MPYADPMSWIAKERRWIKRISGHKPFIFVPKKHGLPPTEEGSREGMRTWWSAQKAILESGKSEHEKTVAKLFLSAVLGLDVLSENVDIGKGIVKQLLDANSNNQLAIFVQEKIPQATDQLLGNGTHSSLESIANNVVEALIPQAKNQSNSLNAYADKWLEKQQQRVAINDLSEGTLQAYSSRIERLKSFWGNATIDQLNNEFVDSIYFQLMGLELANGSKKSTWETFQSFVKYLADFLQVVKKPTAIMGKKLSDEAKNQKDVWTVEEYQEALNNAEGVYKLALLLAANCAFYASDMTACLEFVNWEMGAIVDMKRVKNERKNWAKRTYFLWPETLELLKKHGHELKDAYSKILHFTEKLPKSMKQFRHTTKSFLANSKYAGLLPAMTGEVRKTDDEKYYVKLTSLKNAFAFLRKQYGF